MRRPRATRIVHRRFALSKDYNTSSIGHVRCPWLPAALRSERHVRCVVKTYRRCPSSALSSLDTVDVFVREWVDSEELEKERERGRIADVSRRPVCSVLAAEFQLPELAAARTDQALLLGFSPSNLSSSPSTQGDIGPNDPSLTFTTTSDAQLTNRLKEWRWKRG